MRKDVVQHLTKEEIIKNGSYFTPESIVKVAKSWISKYFKDNTVCIDFGCGYGAFISEFLDLPGKKIATDIDEKSIQLIKENYFNVKTFCENSLLNISREKFASVDEKIIVIGNPPYNDITSEYKKGQKGQNICDEDVYARDLGISFLKMFNKIKAEYVCVLHPLSYLSKKTNFNSLKEFKDNYKLIKGSIFSSSKFETIKKENSEFPVLIALYRRNSKGMKYEDILNFNFDIFESYYWLYRLKDFSTIDGIVEKYPSKNKNPNSLQFYTLRDINALKRNKTFITGPCSNGIVVSKRNLFYYAWLDYFKNNFNPRNMYLYGNLSPLMPLSIENLKEDLNTYIINSNPIVKEWFAKNDEKFYNKYINKKINFEKLENELKKLIIV